MISSLSDVPLFAGLSKRTEAPPAPKDQKEFDVPVTVLFREGNN